MSVFHNYANALIEDASPNDRKVFLEDLKEFLGLFKNSEVSSNLKSPKLSSDKKVELLRKPLSQLNVRVVNTINALLKRGHGIRMETAIQDIISHIERKCGIEIAVIRTPVPLEDSEVDAFRTTLAKILQKELRIKTILDRTLIAGFKVQVAGKFFDNSISNHLTKLKDRFDKSEGKYEN
jgi:F-type H+-transporting ATPase subunit delta